MNKKIPFQPNCGRINKVREFLKKKKGGCFLTFNPSNIFYLTGISEVEGILAITEKKVDLFVPELCFYQAIDSNKNIQIHKYNEDDLINFLDDFKKTFFISTEISYLTYLKISKRTKRQFVPAENIFISLRSIKDEKEIELIEKAKKVTEKTLDEISNFIQKENKFTELDLLGEIKYLLNKNGAESESFEPIVASGIYSSYPHHKAKNKIIEKGEVIVVDIGADFCGYKSDLTNTFFYGDVSDEIKNVYKIVKDVREIATEYIYEKKQKGKIRGKDVHQKAITIFKKYNLEKYFIHSLGHGVGIDIHEKPNLSPGSNDIIEKGNVFTIEPGIYMHKKFGIRLEQMVILKN